MGEMVLFLGTVGALGFSILLAIGVAERCLTAILWLLDKKDQQQ